MGATLRDVIASRRRAPTRPGPVKWCAQCSRFHAARKPCDLYLRKVTVNHANRTGRRKGRETNRVQRWCH